MKTKMMTLALCSVLTFSASTYANCLDVIPTSKDSYKIELIKAQSDLDSAKRSEQLYYNIASDAKRTNNISKALAFAALTPISIQAGGVGLALAARSATVLSMIPGLGLVGANLLQLGVLTGPFVTSGYLTVKNFKDYLSDRNISEEDIEELVKNFEDNLPRNCSYVKTNLALDEARKEVMEESFDGSLTNRVIDHITLGNLSKDASEKLYSLAVIKRIMAESKLDELKRLQFN